MRHLPAIELFSHQTTGLAALAVLFGFIVARVRQRSVERERTLAEAGSALVSATSGREIGMAGAEAARRLAGDQASVLAVNGAMAYSDGTGWPLTVGAVRALRDAAGEAIVTLDEATCLALHLPLGRRRALVHMLGTREGLDSMLVVAGRSVEQSGVRRALHGLGVRIELALENGFIPLADETSLIIEASSAGAR